MSSVRKIILKIQKLKKGKTRSVRQAWRSTCLTNPIGRTTYKFLKSIIIKSWKVEKIPFYINFLDHWETWLKQSPYCQEFSNDVTQLLHIYARNNRSWKLADTDICWFKFKISYQIISPLYLLNFWKIKLISL